MTNVLLVGFLAVFAFLVLSRVSRDETISLPQDGSASGTTNSVEGHLRAGRKIEAIKLLREESGMGLKEAKEAVEALARRMALEDGNAG